MYIANLIFFNPVSLRPGCCFISFMLCGMISRRLCASVTCCLALDIYYVASLYSVQFTFPTFATFGNNADASALLYGMQVVRGFSSFP